MRRSAASFPHAAGTCTKPIEPIDSGARRLSGRVPPSFCRKSARSSCRTPATGIRDRPPPMAHGSSRIAVINAWSSWTLASPVSGERACVPTRPTSPLPWRARGRSVDDSRAQEALHVRYHPSAHQAEHSVQIELPLLQHVLGSVQLVPIIVGRLDGPRRSAWPRCCGS